MRRNAISAMALLVLGVPSSAYAQAAHARAHGSMEVSLSATPILESAGAMVGTAALLNLGGRLAFGVGGNLMLGTSVLEGLETDSTAPDPELRMAYAGLLLQVRVLGSARNGLALRGMVGAGNAKIRLRSDEPSDNFGVLEPELVGTFTLMGPLQLGVGAGYRRVFGVGDLPAVAPTDLMGYTARIRFSIGTG